MFLRNISDGAFGWSFSYAALSASHSPMMVFAFFARSAVFFMVLSRSAKIATYTHKQTVYYDH